MSGAGQFRQGPSATEMHPLATLLEAAIEALTNGNAGEVERMSASLRNLLGASSRIPPKARFSSLQLKETHTRLRILAALLEATERNLRVWRRALGGSDRAAYGSISR